MRIKMRLKNLGQLNKIIEKKVTQTIKSKETTNKVAKVVAEGIQESNFSVTSKGTLAARRYLEKGNKTDKKYSRTKINFTFTGELIKDLIKNVKLKTSKKGAEIKIEHSKGLHKKYKKPDGTPLKGKAVSYKNINKYLNALGYYYLIGVSKKNTEEIIRYLKKEILRRFK